MEKTKVVKVVCGIIYKGDKVFIARRKEGKTLAGYWEFPGGKVEEGENEVEALKRELDEELGMKVQVNHFITSNIHSYEHITIELRAYHCEYQEANYYLNDHDKFTWASLRDIEKLKISSADLPILKNIICYR